MLTLIGAMFADLLAPVCGALDAVGPRRVICFDLPSLVARGNAGFMSMAFEYLVVFFFQGSDWLFNVQTGCSDTKTAK